MTDDDDVFTALALEALAEIPAEFQPYLENVAILVEDEPPLGRPYLGLYHGSTTRHRDAAWKQPDTIRLYRGPMLRAYGDDPERLRAEVRRLVRHEVAHHFGISDERLIELDRY